MNKEQAINLLTNLANLSIKKGIIENINDAALIVTALEVLKDKMDSDKEAKGPTVA